MVSRFAGELQLPLSKERLESYRPSSGTDLEMVTTYFWNLALGEALHPAVQSLEVALRNGIHAAASTTFRSDFWFDRPGLLLVRELAAVAEARQELGRNNKQQNAGRVVAALKFGFWTGLLNRPYERPWWHANNLALLKAAFPHVPRHYRSRQAVWQRCDDVRRLRNRITHAEPVWNRPRLLQHHAEIIDAIGWISPPLRDQLTAFDRFLDTYHNGQRRIEIAIKSRLGIP